MQTTCPVTATSAYALCFLSECSGRGTVHSVYRKTVNLLIDGQLLALQASGSALSPLSLITALDESGMALPGLCAGAPASASPQELIVGGRFCFDLRRAAVYDLQLAQTLTKEEEERLQRLSRKALALRSAGSFELLLTGRDISGCAPFLPIAKKRLADAKTLLGRQLWADAADELRRLIGLGLGLTPGGDDFLCGILAGLSFCGRFTHPFTTALSAQIAAHLDDTNDISAAFLRCALQGQYSLAVNRLPALRSAKEILSVFSGIGHSSGTDTLCGIYWALLAPL